MALLGNYNLLHKLPVKFSAGTSGALGSMAANRSNFNMSGRSINMYASFASWDRKSGLPNGSRPPTSWLMPYTAGGLASINFMNGLGTFVSGIVAGRNIASNSITGTGSLLATGDIYAILVSAITSSGALVGGGGRGRCAETNISGSGTLSGTSVPCAILFASIDGSGTLVGLGGLGLGAEANISGVGDLSGTGVLYAYLVSALNGNGTVVGNGEFIAQCLANILGTSSFVVNVGGRGVLICSVSGSGQITSAMWADGFMYANVSTYVGGEVIDVSEQSKQDIADRVLTSGLLTEYAFLDETFTIKKKIQQLM